MRALKWDEWLASRERKREILRAAGLSAPSRRKVSYNTAERRMRAEFGGGRIPGFACRKEGME